MRCGLPTAAVLLFTLAAACTPVTLQEGAPAPAAQSAAPPAAPGPPRLAVLANADIQLSPVATISSAITMAIRTGDPNIYVGSQNGFVWRVSPKGRLAVALDLSSIVLCCGERGLLGMDFNPAGDKLYIHYSRTGDGWTAVSEFPFANGVGNLDARRLVLAQLDLEGNHNGGSLLFGPDDYLYLALGDGGGGNDGRFGNGTYSAFHSPTGNGQKPDTLLGKILRIDPTADPDLDDSLKDYLIPTDNPFDGADPGNFRDEIWASGLRNPFRMSFDDNGDLWVGDVGQGAREEVDFVADEAGPAPGGRAANFGWNRREGDIPGPDTTNPPQTGFVEPVLAPTHGNPFNCAIIGGYVYRGTRIPDLVGAYVFTDNCNTSIRAFTPTGGVIDPADVFDLDPGVGSHSSFGEDANGELYLLSLSSGLWRIDPGVPPIYRN